MSKEQQAASAAATPGRTVRATRDGGFYKGQRIKVGMTFTLLRASDFSAKWMADVDASASDDLAGVGAGKPVAGGAAPRTGSSSRVAAAAVRKSGDVI